METGGAGGAGGGGGIATGDINDTAAQAKELFNAVRQEALKYEKAVAGAKLGRDKGKAVTG